MRKHVDTRSGEGTNEEPRGTEQDTVLIPPFKGRGHETDPPIAGFSTKVSSSNRIAS